jgi:uncharacterized protein YbjQ (UPF0145 family)
VIVTTAEQVEGRRVVKTLGLVSGSTIRAKHIGKDIMAQFRGIVGGEVTEYTEMMNEAREEAVQRMIQDAEKKGANAVISMRFSTAMIMQFAAEILAYGTGVVLE